MHERQIVLSKARESIDGAESEFANARYNNCANRCYYACFQSAIVALADAGILTQGDERSWSHAFVQSAFVGDLINRRKLYPGRLRDVLARTYVLREVADYRLSSVSQVQAGRALRRAREFLAAIERRGGEYS